MLLTAGFPTGFRAALAGPSSFSHTSTRGQLCLCASVTISYRLAGQVDVQESNAGLLVVEQQRYSKQQSEHGLDAFEESLFRKVICY